MAIEKIYGPWIKWPNGDCPVPPDTLVEVKLRSGTVLGPFQAASYGWQHNGGNNDIMEYCTVTVTEQADLDAAEQLLCERGYTVTPPAKPLTFEDVVPMTEAPPEGTKFWTISAVAEEGVYNTLFLGSGCDHIAIKRRMAYLDKEHALIAARHIFGLKGGKL